MSEGKSKLDLRVKRIHDDLDPADGVRILVDRLWPRGVSKEAAALDRWMKEIAPSHDLRKEFGHDPDRWEEFMEAYAEELERKPELIAELHDLAARGTVTLLYSARDRRHNQAVALASYLANFDG